MRLSQRGRLVRGLLCTSLLGACDPGRFDGFGLEAAPLDAGNTPDAANLDGQLAEASTPEPAHDAAGSADSAAQVEADAAVDPNTCAAPAVRALRVDPNSLRVLARIKNPDRVAGRYVRAPVQALGDKLLWPLMATPAATSAPDGGVVQPGGYATLARSSLEGPWSTSTPSSLPVELKLEDVVGGDGLPLRLVPPDTNSGGLELQPVGIVVVRNLALVYLKQFYYFFSTSITLGSLSRNDFVLQSKPIDLFDAGRNEPSLGTSPVVYQGQVYSLGCKLDSNSTPATYPCTVGRAPLETVAGSDSYRVFQDQAAPSGYTPTLAAASTVLLEGAEAISLSYNAYLGQWLIVTSGGRDVNEGTAYLRTAPTPEGPWSEPLALSLPVGPEGQTARVVIEQPTLSQRCGQRLVLSSLQPTRQVGFGEILAGSIELLSIELR